MGQRNAGGWGTDACRRGIVDGRDIIEGGCWVVKNGRIVRVVDDWRLHGVEEARLWNRELFKD